jgi:Lrp/AsnC family transcriptional regulator, leucine-responsive regulatory protein
MKVEPRLDPIDQQILVHLQTDARISMKELGARVGLSGPGVAERVRRLEDRGVVCGYRAEVSPDMCGRPLRAFISVAIAYERYPVASGAEREFASQLADMDDVLECYRVTGEDCYLLLVAVPDVGRLEELVSRLGQLGRTKTALVLSTPIRRRPILSAVER